MTAAAVSLSQSRHSPTPACRTAIVSGCNSNLMGEWTSMRRLMCSPGDSGESEDSVVRQLLLWFRGWGRGRSHHSSGYSNTLNDTAHTVNGVCVCVCV